MVQNGKLLSVQVVVLLQHLEEQSKTDGDFRVHTFNSAGAFVVTEVGDSTQPFGNTVDYLVVAGGGGGGGFASGDFNNFGSGGGGGAGGVLKTDGFNYAVSAGSYSVNVGGGGTGGTGNSAGSPGSNSSLGTQTAIGGLSLIHI